MSSPTSQAAEDCAGLDTALQDNLNFIVDQQQVPDVQSADRIANRQAVLDLIQRRRNAAGCVGAVGAGQPQAAAPRTTATRTTATRAATPPRNTSPPVQADPAAGGDVVCAGSTVTLSGEDGAPAASSNQFPAGTRLKVTNLDNGRSITVSVTGVSGSCALLNNAAFGQVREPGKFLIRRARVERVG